MTDTATFWQTSDGEDLAELVAPPSTIRDGVPVGRAPYSRHIPELWSLPQGEIDGVQLWDLPVWCCWKTKPPSKPGGKMGKVPVSPKTGRTGGWSVKDSEGESRCNLEFFTDAATAWQYAQDHPEIAGIGIATTREYGIAGGDPDHSRDPETGEMSEKAQEILEAANTYAEVSPGQAGYRFLFIGSFGGFTGNRDDIEFYEDGRFLTITGDHVAGTPDSLEHRDLTELGRRYFPPEQPEQAGGGKPKRKAEPANPAQPQLAPAPTRALDAFMLPSHVLEWITSGVADPKLDRSNCLFGAAKDLFKAGATRSEVLAILNNPEHGISIIAADHTQTPPGSARCRQWLEKYTLDKAQAEGTTAPPDDLKQEARQNFLDSFKEPEKGPLPAFPEDLLALPYGLGELQAFVFGTMAYPSPAGAGITALAIMTSFAQRDITIESQDGLGLNEQYMLIGGTGTGKDAPRRAFRAIHKAVHKEGFGTAPSIIASLPASPQGLHKLLEEDRTQFILSDEHGKRWASLEHNHHAKQLEEYLKELFSSSLYSVNPGVSKTDKYQDVWNPRVSILATSTPGHVASAMEAANGESGVYNRWLILPLEDGEERPQKRYTGLKFNAPAEVVELLKWVQELGETSIKFEGEAFKAYMDLDQRITEPLKIKDNVLAGRLAEHGIKMAGLIALSDRRTSISPGDLKTAFAIVEGIYHRMKASLGEHEAMDDAPDHVKAMDAIKRYLTKNETFTKGAAFACCRPAKRLNSQQKDAIFRELLNEGFCELIPGTRGQYTSHVYGLHVE